MCGSYFPHVLHLGGQTVHCQLPGPYVGGAVGGGRGGDALLPPPAQAEAGQHRGQLQRLLDLLQLHNPVNPINPINFPMSLLII